VPAYTSAPKPADWTSAKRVLDAKGPEALAAWVKSQNRVLLTDTTMRDAHQSLFATRARTQDLVRGAVIANDLLRDCFSFEAWGGATFDVCMRFLDECPWDRLREIRKACPDVCLQMLIRGANAVGYTSYPDNVVTEFVRLAAVNGMDVFRIFDCFNDIENMRVSIDAVRANNKVAEVCLCYTGEVLTSKIYHLDYYKSVAKAAADAGAHIIGIKDMSGLLRPLEAGPLLKAIREVTDLPIHFHTHATSSGSIATCIEMARHNCDIIDLCTASMADGTSQPSLNTFVAMMQGAPNDTGINFLSLEPYDMYWARVRDMYSPFESGMKSGSARVYEHQIPGGECVPTVYL
jgi:pyruvate carboxylase